MIHFISTVFAFSTYKLATWINRSFDMKQLNLSYTKDEEKQMLKKTHTNPPPPP